MKTALGRLLLVFGIGFASWGYAKETYKELSFIPSLAVGIPHPWNLAADLRIPERFSVGAGFGTLSYTFNDLIQGTPLKLGIFNFELRGRWHPFKGAFFLGCALGRQRLEAEATESISVATLSVPTKIAITQWSTYVTPHIGWMWILDSHLTFGFELGAQLPFVSTTSVSVSVTDAALQDLLSQVQATAEYQDLNNQVNERANQGGSQALPFITLLRVGYAF